MNTQGVEYFAGLSTERVVIERIKWVLKLNSIKKLKTISGYHLIFTVDGEYLEWFNFDNVLSCGGWVVMPNFDIILIK